MSNEKDANIKINKRLNGITDHDSLQHNPTKTEAEFANQKINSFFNEKRSAGDVHSAIYTGNNTPTLQINQTNDRSYPYEKE